MALNVKHKTRKEMCLMKGKKCKFLLVSTIMILCLGFNAGKGMAEDPEFVKIAGSGIAGTWFRICAATAEILNQNLKDTVFTATLGGGLSNIKRVESGQIYMGLTMTSSGLLAHTGKYPFKQKYGKSRALLTVYINPYELVTPAKSEIRGVKDMLGRRFAPSLPGWSTELFSQILLKAHGMSYEDIEKAGGKVHFVNWTEMVKLMKDGRLDAAMFATPDPVPQIMDINTVMPVRIVQVEKPVIDKILEEYPSFVTIKTPANTYKGQTEDVVNIADGVMLMISEDASDHLAYSIVKTIYDNVKTLGKVHPALKVLNPKRGLEGIKIPLHPGAAKYYKEQGIAVP
jgi:TRAP transporter TAXI family solute receptor